MISTHGTSLQIYKSNEHHHGMWIYFSHSGGETVLQMSEFKLSHEATELDK